MSSPARWAAAAAAMAGCIGAVAFAALHVAAMLASKCPVDLRGAGHACNSPDINATIAMTLALIFGTGVVATVLLPASIAPTRRLAVAVVGYAIGALTSTFAMLDIRGGIAPAWSWSVPLIVGGAALAGAWWYWRRDAAR